VQHPFSLLWINWDTWRMKSFRWASPHILANHVHLWHQSRDATLVKAASNSIGMARIFLQPHCLDTDIVAYITNFNHPAMMKLGGIHSAAEAVNFLVDKIGHPYITSYNNHVSSHPNARKAPHAIFPDLHAFNFPTGGQRVNDSGATSAAEAFFKIKTFTACKSRYNHNNTNLKPVD
jgi:hypothetical protein